LKPIKVIIADDHRIVSEGIKQLLELDGDIEVIGQARNGIDCLDLMKKTNPEVLLLDINMPTLNGLGVLQRIRKKKTNDNIRILMLTIHNEVEYLQRAMNFGADGYVLKDSEYYVLKKAIFTVVSGNTYVQDELVPLLKQKQEFKDHLDSDDKFLTRREIEVLKLISKGLFNKEIAYQLSISEKTVKNHVSNIFKKIHVSDRTQAAVYAIKNNIVDI
jgi:DNA-binding NarL/FixJ family response regulator